MADSQLWNAQIYPFLQTTIKGAIWYQGEADTKDGYAESYWCGFPAMIEDWRQKWAENSDTSADFPFGYVHLSSWDDTTSNRPCGDAVLPCQASAIVRWGQSANYGYVPNAAMPNTFMASAIDYGDPDSPWGDIHPRYKQQVAERLATAAKEVVYGVKGIYWQGPIASNAFLIDRVVTINFENVGGSDAETLDIRPPYDGKSWPFEVYVNYTQEWRAQEGPVVNGFDKYSVQFSLNSDIDAADVSQVRYAWFHSPCFATQGPENCIIYSPEGLPAIPFIKDVANL